MSPSGEALPVEGQLARGALLSGVGILFFLAVSAALIQQTLGLDALFVTKSIGFYLLGFLVLFASLFSRLTGSRFGAANQTTLLRGSLVALLFGFVAEPAVPLTAWLVVIIGTVCIGLDGLDGWLARREGLVSRWGARFDMETDALAILALSLLAWQLDKAGIWVLAAGGLRYLFLIASFVFRWLAHELPPSRRPQTICVIQVTSLIVCLTPSVTLPWSGLVAAVGLALLVWSFSIDSCWLARRHKT